MTPYVILKFNVPQCKLATNNQQNLYCTPCFFCQYVEYSEDMLRIMENYADGVFICVVSLYWPGVIPSMDLNFRVKLDTSM